MKILNNLSDVSKNPKAVTVGNFDGIHKGHQTLINKTKEISTKNNVESLTFTFNKLPKRKIKKEYVILSAVFIIGFLFFGLVTYENYKSEKAAELFENAKYSFSQMRLTTAESEINEALSY